jgi:hypothetical protein
MFTPITETGKLWTTRNSEPLREVLAKGLKPEADLDQFSRILTKLTVEIAVNA